MARLTIAALTVVGTVAGCGSSTAGNSANASSGSSAAIVSEANATIERLAKSPGTYASPPTTAPTPKKNQTIWILSCGQAYDLCARPAAAAQAAVESLGWTAKIFDTKGDPSTGNDGIRQALAQKADGVYAYYVDCRYVVGALKQANAAGMPVVGAESGPCPGEGDGPSVVNTSATGDGHYTFTVNYSGGATPAPNGIGSYTDMLRGMGIAGADAAIINHNGQANALIYKDDAGYGAGQVADGAATEFGKCAGCQSAIETVPYGAVSRDRCNSWRF